MKTKDFTEFTLSEQITNYLSNGGLFNPEMMEHDKVRNLLMRCRARLDVLEPQRVIAVEALNELQELRKQIIHGGAWTKKVDDLFKRAREAGF